MGSNPAIYTNIEEFFSQDPRIFLGLIGKKCILTSKYNETSEGLIYLIESISATIILMKELKTVSDSIVMFKHAIKKIEIMESDQECMEKLKIVDKEIDVKGCEKRKIAVKEWLRRHLITAEEDGANLRILNEVLIEPPYRTEQCYCGNLIILQRILNILSKMPDVD